MAKLHEIIAAEGDRKQIATDVIGETMTTFVKKPDHFLGQRRNVTMLDEARTAENVVDYAPIVETVDKKLLYTWGHLSRFIDLQMTKETANCDAQADVVVDGNVLLSNVPAGALLALEKHLTRLLDLYKTIPTLNPSIDWVADDSHELEGVFRQEHPTQQYKTEKTLNHRVIYEATEHHPAQVHAYNVDSNVGMIETVRYSSMITPAQKSEWLGRISDLLIAVKEARQRANSTKVEPVAYAEIIRNFVHGV